MKAHYAGDNTYAPSDSSPVTVTVAPEPSTTLISIPVFDPSTGRETGNTPASVVYGSTIIARMDVGNAKAAVSFPMNPVCATPACPTGSVTLTDSVSGGASGVFPLNSEGYTEDLAVQLSGGTHQLSASYPGDNSYGPSTGSYTLTVTPVAMHVSPPTISCYPCTVGGQISMYVDVDAASIFTGATPTGTITFYDGTTPLSGTVTYYGMGGVSFSSSAAFLQGSLATTLPTIGTHQISAQYSGDANYGQASGSASPVSLVYATSGVATANPSTVNYGQTVNITATVTGASKTPPMTGTFNFSSMPNLITPTAGTDANGNQTLTATVTITPQSSNAIQVNYSGDANYSFTQMFASVTVNIPDFSLNLPSSPLLVTAGQPGSEVATIVPASNLASSSFPFLRRERRGRTSRGLQLRVFADERKPEQRRERYQHLHAGSKHADSRRYGSACCNRFKWRIDRQLSGLLPWNASALGPFGGGLTGLAGEMAQWPNENRHFCLRCDLPCRRLWQCIRWRRWRRGWRGRDCACPPAHDHNGDDKRHKVSQCDTADLYGHNQRFQKSHRKCAFLFEWEFFWLGKLGW